MATTKVSYKFNVTAPSLPYEVVPAAPHFPHDEFSLTLPRGWFQVARADGKAFEFASGTGAKATLTIEPQEAPASELSNLAEARLAERLQALEQLAPGQVQVFRCAIKPLASGTGMEIAFAAELNGDVVYRYLGHVTARKAQAFDLTLKTDRATAAALFEKLEGGYQPKLP